MNRSKCEARIEEIKNRIKVLDREIDDMEFENSDLEDQIRNNEGIVREYSDEIFGLEIELEELEEQVEKYEFDDTVSDSDDERQLTFL